LLGSVTEILIDSLARYAFTGLSIGIVSLTRKTLGASSLDDVVALCAIALTTVEVVNLVGSALGATDTLVNIVSLSYRALSAEVVDEVEAGLADATT
jgi:hypothetical protein